MDLSFCNPQTEWEMVHFPSHMSANKMKLTGAPGDFKFPLVENGIQVFGDTDLYGSFYGVWKGLTYYLDTISCQSPCIWFTPTESLLSLPCSLGESGGMGCYMLGMPPTRLEECTEGPCRSCAGPPLHLHPSLFHSLEFLHLGGRVSLSHHLTAM